MKKAKKCLPAPRGAVFSAVEKKRFARHGVEKDPAGHSQSPGRLQLINSLATHLLLGLDADEITRLTVTHLGEYFPKLRVSHATQSS